MGDAQRLAAVGSVIRSLADTIEHAEHATKQRGRGGQQVPFHGDFANATPGTLAQLKWWVRELERAVGR